MICFRITFNLQDMSKSPHRSIWQPRLSQMKILNRFTGDTLFEVENLRDADLRGAYLRGADLRGVNLRDADLRDADLRDADLRGVNLRGANLRNAVLRDADLRGADLRGTDLIVGGQRSDGYRFLLFRTDGDIFVSAGCRYFNISDARNHWNDTRPPASDRLGAESLALVDHLEATAKIWGWL
jgi:hypothetical protein